MEPEAYRILPRAIWQRISKDFDQAIFLSNIFFIKKNPEEFFTLYLKFDFTCDEKLGCDNTAIVLFGNNKHTRHKQTHRQQRYTQRQHSSRRIARGTYC